MMLTMFSLPQLLEALLKLGFLTVVRPHRGAKVQLGRRGLPDRVAAPAVVAIGGAAHSN
jgi:hypothetical protein